MQYACLVSPDTFANNRLSINLISDHSVSALVDFITEEGQRSALALSDYVVDPQFGQSLSMSETVFQYRNRDEGLQGLTFYQWLQLSVRLIVSCCLVYFLAVAHTTLFGCYPFRVSKRGA